MSEELYFRFGSENWTLIQKIKSSVLFGTIHFLNFVYPISVVIAIVFSGLVYMLVYNWAYRKYGNNLVAALISATTHHMYNILAFVSFILLILYALVTILI